MKLYSLSDIGRKDFKILMESYAIFETAFYNTRFKSIANITWF